LDSRSRKKVRRQHLSCAESEVTPVAKWRPGSTEKAAPRNLQQKKLKEQHNKITRTDLTRPGSSKGSVAVNLNEKTKKLVVSRTDAEWRPRKSGKSQKR
jgi:hypothetical protein